MGGNKGIKNLALCFSDDIEYSFFAKKGLKQDDSERGYVP